MQNKSFTLIELLVVIVIIGILAGVIIVSVSSSINKANFAKAQSFSNTVQNELLGDLVSEWTFNNPSLPGEDTWGNNDGTVYGAATYKTKADGVCLYGGCYSFDGSNNYIDIPDSSDLDISSEITLSVWVRRSLISTSNQGILAKEDTGGYALVLNYGTGDHKITFVSPNISTRKTTNAISDYNWHLIVCTIDESSSSLKFYLDGALDSSQGTVGALGANASPFFIGRRLTGYFNGLIDGVRIYNTVLSSSQIKEQYVAGLNSLLASNNISKEEYNQRLNALAYAE